MACQPNKLAIQVSKKLEYQRESIYYKARLIPTLTYHEPQ